jgi:hypothetical protein
VTVEVDPVSGQLATAACSTTRGEVFIAGSQPQEFCRLHGGGGGVTHVAGWDTPDQPAQSSGSPRGTPSVPRRVAQNAETPAEAPKAPAPPSKPKGLFGKIRDMLK